MRVGQLVVRNQPGPHRAVGVEGLTKGECACTALPLSVREWQRRARTLTLGKSFDTHGPMGPWLVTNDELTDPHALSLRTWVSGQLLQDSNTKGLVFNCWDAVEQLSEVMTLEPGDVVSTGTPAGVGVWMD